MGKGDKKTKRGKIIAGTYGKLRPAKKRIKIPPKSIKGKSKKK